MIGRAALHFSIEARPSNRPVNSPSPPTLLVHVVDVMESGIRPRLIRSSYCFHFQSSVYVGAYVSRVFLVRFWGDIGVPGRGTLIR